MPHFITSFLPTPVKNFLQKGRRALRKQGTNLSARWRGIILAEPNFVFRPLAPGYIIVDVGCGHDADFSTTLLNRYPQTQAYAIDPTQKHAVSLHELTNAWAGRFHHLPLAVATQSGEILFHESEQNESGSTQSEHTNVQHDLIKTYSVATIHPREIPALIKADVIHLLKMDIEGEEYPLIRDLQREDLRAYQQLFIEFHHRQIKGLTERDTLACVQKIDSLGFVHFTVDQINYLFYRKT